MWNEELQNSHVLVLGDAVWPCPVSGAMGTFADKGRAQKVCTGGIGKEIGMAVVGGKSAISNGGCNVGIVAKKAQRRVRGMARD